MADEVDSKSIGGNTVRVQVPQPADLKALENIGFFLYFQGLLVFSSKYLSAFLILFHLPPFLRHQTANPPALLGSQA